MNTVNDNKSTTRETSALHPDNVMEKRKKPLLLEVVHVATYFACPWRATENQIGHIPISGYGLKSN
jgi:hypothetical protein